MVGAWFAPSVPEAQKLNTPDGTKHTIGSEIILDAPGGIPW
jgi:hypothetical protein